MIDSSICVGALDLDRELAGRRVVEEQRLAGLDDAAGEPLADAGAEDFGRGPVRRGQLALEGDRRQLLAVADEDAAVVVIDQLAELVRDRHADLAHVVRAVELAGERLEHLQVRDRADVLAALSSRSPAARSPSRRRRRPGSCRAPSQSSSPPRRRRRARAGSPRARGPGRSRSRRRSCRRGREPTASSRVTSRVASATACSSWLAGDDHGELLAADPADDVARRGRWRADGRRARPAPRRRPRGRRRRSPS